jgi:hypothetical protein
MKIYGWHIAPNPRRLHIYLAEKGLKIPLEEVAKYPHAMVPISQIGPGSASTPGPVSPSTTCPICAAGWT